MSDFAARLTAWQKIHGRHDLPWQNTHDPYRIWVSEIMLQQTQVTAVIGYYANFMNRFPDIATLAAATQEEVLQYWSGLGYYARGRNLHKAAQSIVNDYGGAFPQDFDTVQTLPGIGRSTAAAIVSFAFGQSQTILDGNVKRVLTRHFDVEGWPNAPKVNKQLWSLAESLVPATNMIAYTQGLMDLGATICTRRKPKCTQCPLQDSCQALKLSKTQCLPTPKPKKTTPQKYITMMIIYQGDQVLLQKRPQTGIWAGLWSLPEISMQDIASKVVKAKFGLSVEPEEPLDIVKHVFTHYKLDITPQPLALITSTQSDTPLLQWMNIDTAIEAALPTPVRKILNNFQQKLT